MRFSVYIARLGKLYKVAKCHRNVNGLYIFSHSGGAGTYSTYHEDGRYWSRIRGRKSVKKLRQPLDAFVGAETVDYRCIVTTEGAPLAGDPTGGRIQSEDIVVDETARLVLIEFILSDRPIHLPDLPDRLNRRVWVKNCTPLLVVEAFTTQGNAIPSPRYSRTPLAMYLGDLPPRI